MAGLAKLSPGAFVLELLHSGTWAHKAHLKSRSYAKHIALDDFYKEIVDLTNTFAETYQGRYELIDYPASHCARATDPLTQLEQLRKYVDDNRYGVCDDSELQNIIDEIVSLVDKTIYKLTFLS